MRQQKIKTNGIELNVAIAGEGPPVLLLHGFPDTHTVWREQIDALSDAGYRVIAPDLRGYGASEAPPATQDYGIATLRDDIIGLMDALDVEQACLIGHDWGSLIGWYLCMHAPERIQRFAALSVGHPAAYANAGIGQKCKAWYAALFQLPGIAESLLQFGNLMALKPQAADAEQLADWRANFARPGRLTAALNYYRANRHLAADPSYDKIHVPVLGIWSAHDPALTENQMRDSAAYMAAPFRYHRIDGAVGHWLQLEQAEDINQLLTDFCAEALTPSVK
ncbi:alpha/beta fold hydrolase [Massilia sp. CF038]|uniref:alpha/beta fold hydrolase n=1 Tax=Massilia sp. CF038 TaxID=1881045 RepID=UPI000920AE73|nr:alpha/beta hydrolase [Massilia sp. CF038]SHG63383.1 Pimeloyl-ACP methyl ester carboxylesterase [Massilia sp. CF038]